MQPIGMMVACAWVRLTVLESFVGGCLPPGTRLRQTLRGKFLLYFRGQHLLGHTYGAAILLHAADHDPLLFEVPPRVEFRSLCCYAPAPNVMARSDGIPAFAQRVRSA